MISTRQYDKQSPDMDHIWRPQPLIQVKALGLVWRDGRLLASEICQDDGSIKGVRPLGGQVEFGETWRDALVREFHEELGVQVEVLGQPIFLENIYTHQGTLGHEVVFLADVLLPEDAYQGQACIEYREDNGQSCRARWFEIEELDCGSLALYPDGLKTALRKRSNRS